MEPRNYHNIKPRKTNIESTNMTIRNQKKKQKATI